MKKIFEKSLCLILAAIMLLSILPQITVSADEQEIPNISLPDMTETNGWVRYTFNDAAGAPSINTAIPGGTAREIFNRPATTPNFQGTLGQSGVIDGAIRLNGTADYLAINNDNISNPDGFLHGICTQLSVAFWLKADEFAGKQMLYAQGGNCSGQGGGVQIRLNGSNLQVAVCTSAVNMFPDISLVGREGEWIHVTLSYNGSSAKIYVDAELAETIGTAGAQINASIRGTSIGRSVFAAPNGQDAWGDSSAQYLGGMLDDFRIYKTAVTPRIAGNIPENAVYLQSSLKKNYYISETGDIPAVSANVSVSTRIWEIVDGLGGNGVSLRFCGEDRYLTATGSAISIIEPAVPADATFTQTAALAEPGWANVYPGEFYSYKLANGNYIKANTDGTLTAGAVNMSDENDKLAASFKITGDHTNVIENLRGAVYYPSYALNAPQFWKFYDSTIIDRDLELAESIGINAVRIWVSYEYWREDPAHFEYCYNDFLEKADNHGIKVLVSLFEGCGKEDAGDAYGNISTTSRNFDEAYSITSPAREVYANSTRWNEPREFVTWFFEEFGDDLRQMAIEIYNEPWGNERYDLAVDLMQYAVTVQGDVPIAMGNADTSGGASPPAVELGADLMQYHDNFPGSAAGFESRGRGKIEQAKIANLPMYCTEIQWVGGPQMPWESTYKNLAPTVDTLSQTGKWAGFYWTLMVHPAYLHNNRPYHLTNGIFQDDGTAYSLEDIAAIAPELTERQIAAQFTESRRNPYVQYQYSSIFSDDFSDKHGYKWTVDDGTADFTDGVLKLNGTVTATLSRFRDYSYDITVDSGTAEVIRDPDTEEISIVGNAIISSVLVTSNPIPPVPAEGEPIWVSGEAAVFTAPAKYIDGMGDYIRVSGDDNDGILHGAITAETAAMWIRPKTVSGKQMLYKHGGDINGLALRINNGKLELAAAVNSTRYKGSIDFDGANEWTHLTMVYSGGSVKLYENGYLVLTFTAPATIYAASRGMTFGGMVGACAFDDEWGQWFEGDIDDVRIYNFAAVPSVKGDVNFDSKIDFSDALMALRIVSGAIPTPTDRQAWAANIYDAANASASDALEILKYSIGIIAKF